MQFNPLFTGKLVRLAAPTPDDHFHFARWSENDHYLRIMDNDPARPVSPEAHAAWEQSFLSSPTLFLFRLRTLADDTMIGTVGLVDVQWTHQTAMLIIAIGDPTYWGKGYGSDALRLMMNYAFNELNLYRVWLNVISYNTRAIAAYEKVGFIREGVGRSVIQREGKRYDLFYYGILREEWAALYDQA